jgi:hypothetical protein
MKNLEDASTLGEAPGLAHKQKTKLERLARYKHSSLLRKFVTYGRKKFYNIGPRGGVHNTLGGVHNTLPYS